MRTVKVYGYDVDELINQCNDPISLCRLAVLKLTDTKEKDEAKRRLLERLIQKINEVNQGVYRRVSPIIQSILNELEEALRQHYGSRLGGDVFRIKAYTKSRMIVHSKNDTSALIFEYGTALHPILGVPYIPASSLKGVLRSYLESFLLTDLKIDSIDEILGGREQSSQIVVTDGYPTRGDEKGKILEPEVTTPIYQQSIRENEARPVPVIYPVIAKNVEFTFLVAAKKEALKYFDMVKGWIITAIGEGVGAKTMLGYGLLEVGR